VTRRLPLFLGASLAALALTSLTGSAEAGHAHFSGGAHFSSGGHFGGGVHVGGGGGYHASVHWGGGGYYHPSSWGVRGHIYVGGYRGYYRPYYNYYYPVPAYYGASYYPVEASTYATPGTTVAVVAQPELPKLGIGVFAGGVATDYNTQTNTQETDMGLLGRYRLTDGLIIEGELGKASTSVNGVDNVRVDRRLGGALLYEIGAQNRLAPYILGGIGVEQANVGGNYNTTQDYGEIGAGLRYALTRNLHIAFDLRAGSRSSVSGDNTDPVTGVAKTVVPPSSNSSQSEDYTRGRLSALLYF